MLDGTAKGSTG